MEKNNYLNLNRFYLLTRRHILSNSKGWLIAFGAVSGALLVISLLTAYFNPENLPNLTPTYLTIMFIGGYIFTSNIFNELHDTRKAFHYLTIPVSTTERLLAAWVLTAIIFPFVSILLISLIILAANLIMNLTLNFEPFQQVFSNGNIGGLRAYLITQSIFLLGAAYFRKNNFLKTVLTLFVFSMVVMALVSFFGYIFLSPLSEGSGLTIEPEGMTIRLESLFLETIPGAARIIYYYFSIPFFLVVSWFTLKERQV
jgi:hypothetical protein